MADLGVYIHYPWCGKLCPYCDFPVAVKPRAGIPHQAYLDAVLAELGRRRDDFAGRRLVSIYFGGGTPSLWPARFLEAAIAGVTAAFASGDGADELEVTIEANPADCDTAMMAGWRGAGINRVSLGAQSLADGALRVLGREHDAAGALRAIEAVLAADFRSVSVDLILGVPFAGERLVDGVEASLVELARLKPPHLSIYELTIKERTRFWRQVAEGALVPLADGALADRYTATSEYLSAAGYEHYEVSNYALPGHRAVHNSLYWSSAEFLGLGCGAASFRVTDAGGVRRTNLRSAPRYLRSSQPKAETVTSSLEELAEERLWLGLRTSTGVTETALEGRGELVAWLLSEGLAQRAEGRIQPTLRGFLFADQVARRVVGG